MTEPSDPRQSFNDLRRHVGARIIGQETLVERLLITLLCDGHLVVEGAPGLAKTTAVKALAGALEGSFHRIEFTPDLLPADLTGTEVFRPRDGTFHFERGPVFHNVVLADEVNRAPAKVQSALLEAMGERQVTVGAVTHPLPGLFLVMATQNPLEHEGTYPLPEAQLDRFLMYVRVDYPGPDAERAILHLAREQARGRGAAAPPGPLVSQGLVFAAREAVLDLHMAEAVEEYIVALVAATRDPHRSRPRSSRRVSSSPCTRPMEAARAPRGLSSTDTSPSRQVTAPSTTARRPQPTRAPPRASAGRAAVSAATSSDGFSCPRPRVARAPSTR